MIKDRPCKGDKKNVGQKTKHYKQPKTAAHLQLAKKSGVRAD